MNINAAAINDDRTARPGTRSTYTVQAWKKGGAEHLQSAANGPTPARDAVAAQISRALTSPAEPRTAMTFEQSLASASAVPATDPMTRELTFDDVLDIVNPLQHIPVVNMVYRGMTGDTIGAVGQIIGGGIFGGPIGALSGAVNAITQDITGKDIAANVLGFVSRPFSGN